MREIICNNSRYYYCNRMGIDLTRVPPPLCSFNITGLPRKNYHCLSEEYDIVSYLVDISLMFASLIQLNVINFCVLMVNLN